MDDIRKKIFIIVGAAAGLIVAAVLVANFINRPQLEKTPGIEDKIAGDGVQTAIQEQNKAKTQPTVVTIKQPPKSTLPSTEVYVKQLAGIFIERFLSFSNQDNNQHITDILPMLTDKMAVWVKKQGVAWNQTYHSSVTQVIASSVKQINADKAVVNVDVQQVFDEKEDEIVYKSGKVELVRVGKDWKIDGFYWEN